MSKRIIQRHHITYEPERVVHIFKGEHQILTRMQWYCKKNVSLGFIEALQQFIEDNMHGAVDLTEEYNERRKKSS